jgi:hypothetical protein
MSTGRTLLRHPLVIAGAALGLVTVAVINVQTFAREGKVLGFGPGRGETHLTPPADLADVVQQAVQQERRARQAALGGQATGAPLTRDPFTAAPVGPAPAPVATARTARPAATARPLTCTAIFLGGSRPQALIDDETYGPGDRVRGYEILHIDTEGVRLRRPDGTTFHLSVGPARADSTGYHLVTRVREKNERAATQLIDADTNGGKDR